MNTRQMCRQTRSATYLVALAATFFACGPITTAAQDRSAAAAPFTRPCSTNPVLPAPTSKKHTHKPKPASMPDPAPACLEAKGEGIEVQEFLQNTARDEKWRIGENRSSEDSWSFIRYFDPEELEKYTDTKVLIEPVKFTSGKASVTVRTTDLSDGYSRVQISTRFTGEGTSTDKTWAQPTSSWSLNSKGVLEQELVAALQARYKPVQ